LEDETQAENNLIANRELKIENIKIGIAQLEQKNN